MNRIQDWDISNNNSDIKLMMNGTSENTIEI